MRTTFLSLLVVLLASGGAVASTVGCIYGNEDAVDLDLGADLIVVGKVTSMGNTDRTRWGSRTLLSLKVLRTLYGESPESLNIVWEVENLLTTPECAHDVSPGDEVVALIRQRPNREYFAENDAAVVPKNAPGYKYWIKAIKRNVANASP